MPCSWTQCSGSCEAQTSNPLILSSTLPLSHCTVQSFHNTPQYKMDFNIKWSQIFFYLEFYKRVIGNGHFPLHCNSFYVKLSLYITSSLTTHRALVKSAYQKNNFLISQPKHMLWVLKRTVLMRWFFCVNKTALLSTQNAKNYG